MGLCDWSLSYPVELGDDATLDVDVDLGPVGEGEDVPSGDELGKHRRVNDAVAGRSAHDRDVRPVGVGVVVMVGPVVKVGLS